MVGRLRPLVWLCLLAAATAAAQEAQPARQAARPQTKPVPPATPAITATSHLDEPSIQEAIRDAVKAAAAEMPKLPPAQGPADFRTADSPSSGAISKIDQAFIDAETASCWGPEALKHTPPVIYAGGVPIVLGGLLAVPHVFYAAASGKCK
jgi:hypothetical protein